MGVDRAHRARHEDGAPAGERHLPAVGVAADHQRRRVRGQQGHPVWGVDGSQHGLGAGRGRRAERRVRVRCPGPRVVDPDHGEVIVWGRQPDRVVDQHRRSGAAQGRLQPRVVGPQIMVAQHGDGLARLDRGHQRLQPRSDGVRCLEEHIVPAQHQQLRRPGAEGGEGVVEQRRRSGRPDVQIRGEGQAQRRAARRQEGEGVPHRARDGPAGERPPQPTGPSPGIQPGHHRLHQPPRGAVLSTATGRAQLPHARGPIRLSSSPPSASPRPGSRGGRRTASGRCALLAWTAG